MRAVALERIDLPDFGAPEEPSPLQRETYDARMRAIQERADCDWIVVYGDREHFANLQFLCGFDPRFEEALLVLHGDSRVLLVGNEGMAYARLLPVPLDITLCPSLSLMGQDRSTGQTLREAFTSLGVRAGERLGVIGWKWLEPAEWQEDVTPLAAPAFVIDLLRALAGAERLVVDRTRLLMSPEDGLRACHSADDLARLEFAASRASASVLRVLRAARPGMSERQAIGAMAYEGDPLSAHVMFASGDEVAVGLRSPGARRLAIGDGVTVAIGFWGGLTCRAGVLARDASDLGEGNREFLNRLAQPYWNAIAAWYESVRIGVTGGEVVARITQELHPHGFGSALNPGHLIGADEWVHTPIQPGSPISLRSGMALQSDIIPDCARPGWAANCEDTVALADEEMRANLARAYPSVWARIVARRAFMMASLGLQLAEEVLPLSNIPAYFPPFWLSPDRVLVRRQ